MFKGKLSIMFSCFLACLLLMGVAAAEPVEEPHIISVDGYGEVIAIPDRANVSITILSSAKKAKEAQQENAAIASAVKSALMELGISEKDMKTSNYFFRPVYRQEKNKPDKIIAYSATSSLDVVVNDITKTGQVIDRALSNGANKIDSVTFDLKEPEKYRKEALRAAVLDAETKTQVIANGLGVSIRGIRYVKENAGRVTGRENVMMTKMASDSLLDANAGVETPIEVGDIEVNASVHVEYIID